VAVCGLLGARLLGGTDDTASVWGVRADTVAGQRLTAADLVAVGVRFTERDDRNRYLSARDPLPRDTVATRPLAAGELLPRTALGHADDVDLLEVPLAVPAEAVPATAGVGSVVDVWVTGKAAAEATAVLTDVPVLALPKAGASLGPTTTRQVIVGVEASQQPVLPRAQARLAEGIPVLTRDGGR
jgi:hypothetical protein